MTNLPKPMEVPGVLELSKIELHAKRGHMGPYSAQFVELIALIHKQEAALKANTPEIPDSSVTVDTQEFRDAFARAINEVINTPFAGGFYAGKIMVNGIAYALIVAPKAEGETELPWNKSNDRVVGAESFNDGAANTAAMLQADSDLAKWAAGLNIDGYADWYIPSLDELEVIYRNLKPTTETNTLYARSGINTSAIPPTLPYTRAEPAQTSAEAFQSGGDQAFDDTWYWTSTQHADYSDYAWLQYFGNGNQGNYYKSYSGRARAVRRVYLDKE